MRVGFLAIRVGSVRNGRARGVGRPYLGATRRRGRGEGASSFPPTKPLAKLEYGSAGDAADACGQHNDCTSRGADHSRQFSAAGLEFDAEKMAPAEVSSIE